MPTEGADILQDHERLDGVLFGHIGKGRVVPFGRIVTERLPYAKAELTPHLQAAADAELLREYERRNPPITARSDASDETVEEIDDDALKLAEEALLQAAAKVGTVLS